jgi:DNA end-binding protein Ku
VDDREVESSEIVRGYEYAKGRNIVLTDEDFEKLPLNSKHTIELSAFVNAAEIDPIYYEKSYYLEPDDPGIKPYALLVRALASKGLTALAKLAIRNKERLCALRPVDGTLVLETLYYPDEIRVERGKEINVEVSERELAMAQTLIDLLSEPFQPEKYKDEYREALMAVIESKLQGIEIPEEPEEGAPAALPDLSAALQAAIEEVLRKKEATTA